MAISIFPSSVASRLQPLTGSISECFVAGMRFGEAQALIFEGTDGISVASNAWVGVKDLAALAVEESARLVSAAGDVLAMKGEGDSVSLIAGEGSFFVRYAWDLIEVNVAILAQLETVETEAVIHPAANVDGVLIAGEGTKILPGVFIEGTVVIGENCKIGPNCYIRGATAIGDNCHVGQSVEIKNSILGHGTNVGHLSYVGDSVLGDGVNFGAGTTTSNLRHDGMSHRSAIDGELVDTGRRKFGTIVGPGVHTGIHTAIYPGRKIVAGASTLPNETVTQDVL